MLLAAPVLVLSLSSPAFAHCPGGTGGYVAGGNGNNTVQGIGVTLDWLPSPNVCSSGTSYSISIVHGSSGTSAHGWVQVGWRYYSNYSQPKAYCERKPNACGTGSYAIDEYTVTSGQHRYGYVKNDAGQYECRLDGFLKRTTHVDSLGFINGTWVPVQAESHARHLQLGRIAPEWFDLSDTDKLAAGSGTSWTQMNVQGVGSGDPVWNFSQPQNDGFRVSTDANH